MMVDVRVAMTLLMAFTAGMAGALGGCVPFAASADGSAPGPDAAEADAGTAGRLEAGAGTDDGGPIVEDRFERAVDGGSEKPTAAAHGS